MARNNLHFRQGYIISKVFRTSLSEGIVLSRYWQTLSDGRAMVCLVFTKKPPAK